MTQATILIVEDEPEILEPLSHSLKREGYRVLEADDGLDACRLIGTEEPDLILLDIMLPDLDGWEVCRMLRQHPIPRVASIPVIMLTALNAPDDKYRGLEIGADAYLAKPYSIREVMLQSANLIRRRQQTRQLEQRLEQVTRQEEERVNLNRLLFHELRNQIFILNGYTQMLGSGKQSQRCMDAISRSSEYLNNLAEDMLLIRKVRDGHFALHAEPLKLAEIIREMVHLYTPLAQEKAVEIKILSEPGSAQVRINRPALKIILSTLIDNALKYGPSGQTISISCRQTPDLAEILVADQGPGIPEQEIERIFEPFYRLKTANPEVRGSGLGLHGVRVLSRAMGGDVTVELGPEKNSCFLLKLPLIFHA